MSVRVEIGSVVVHGAAEHGLSERALRARLEAHVAAVLTRAGRDGLLWSGSERGAARLDTEAVAALVGGAVKQTLDRAEPA